MIARMAQALLAEDPGSAMIYGLLHERRDRREGFARWG